MPTPPVVWVVGVVLELGGAPNAAGQQIPSGPLILPPSVAAGTYPFVASPSAAAAMRLTVLADIGNETTVAGGSPDRYRDQAGLISLAGTPITGRLPTVEVAFTQTLLPQVGVRLSGEISQSIRDPVTNPDLEDAFQQRQFWRVAGGAGQRPLFVPQVRDAYISLADPERAGGVQLGQFRVPFGFDNYSTAYPPLAMAPEETPIGDVLGSLGAVNYQPSSLVRRFDVGLMLFGRSGDAHYFLGTFNGSGPNRLDDNGDKDLFARLDWQPSPREAIGLSAWVGNDFGYPGGLGPRPTAAPVKVFRRFYGVHLKFRIWQIDMQGEWVEAFQYGTVPGEGFEAGPRRGWYVDAGGEITGADRVFIQYGNFQDPRTPESRRYESHQAALGTVHAFAPGLSWRTEGQYRWESLGNLGHHLRADYGRYLTSIQWAL